MTCQVSIANKILVSREKIKTWKIFMFLLTRSDPLVQQLLMCHLLQISSPRRANSTAYLMEVLKGVRSV